MGYSMKMGSKQNNSPSAFSMKSSAMLMHVKGHEDKPITNVSYSVNKQKLPAKANEYPGYGGTKTTRTMTTTSSIPGSSSIGSNEFNFQFAQARKRGDEIFTFKGKQYTTELAKPKKSVKTTTFTGETGGIKKLNLQGPSANVLLNPAKPPIDTTNKIIPPSPPKPPKRKKKFRNTDVGKFVRSIGDIQLPQLRLPRIRLGGGGGGSGCKSCRKKLLRTFGSRR